MIEIKNMNMNITKEMIEHELGYEIKDFKLRPLYRNDECIGLRVMVEPKRAVKHLDVTFNICKEEFNKDF